MFDSSTGYMQKKYYFAVETMNLNQFKIWCKDGKDCNWKNEFDKLSKHYREQIIANKKNEFLAFLDKKYNI